MVILTLFNVCIINLFCIFIYWFSKLLRCFMSSSSMDLGRSLLMNSSSFYPFVILYVTWVIGRKGMNIVLMVKLWVWIWSKWPSLWFVHVRSSWVFNDLLIDEPNLNIVQIWDAKIILNCGNIARSIILHTFKWGGVYAIWGICYLSYLTMGIIELRDYWASLLNIRGTLSSLIIYSVANYVIIELFWRYRSWSVVN